MWIHKNLNPNSKLLKLLVVVPHDSVNLSFLDDHPEFFQHAHSDRYRDLFNRYIHLEADKGASELAIDIANRCQRLFNRLGRKDFGVEVFQIDYPRGVVDGGRLPNFSIRPIVKDTAKFTSIDHHSALETIQKDTISDLTAKLDRLNADGGLLLDIHTMAPCSPTYSPEANWENLEEYIESFYDCLVPKQERPLDLLTQDDKNKVLAYPELTREVKEAFKKEKTGYKVKENEPYRVSEPYLMHHLLTHVNGLAIDVPKHLLANFEGPLSAFDIENFSICPLKVKQIGNSISRGTLKALGIFNPDKIDECFNTLFET